MNNNMKSETSLQQPESPIQCANKCGFFGTTATMNLCSKCYRDYRLKEEQDSTAISAVGRLLKVSVAEERESKTKLSVDESVVAVDKVEVASSKKVGSSNRCGCCNKKVGVVGFKCRCGSTFCGSHRYPEEHNCEFDHKLAGREALAKANPLVVADKVQRI